MSTVIEKIFDIFIKQTKKLPQAMIVIYIFTILFSEESIKIVNMLNQKIKIILPESLIDLLTNLHFSQEDLLRLWAFLLVIYTLTVILTVLNQFLKGYSYIVIGSGGDILFEINSIIFLITLIYNTLYNPGIKLDSIHFSGFYSVFVYISTILFIFIFCITYINIFQLYQKINNSELSLKQKIFFNIILFVATICIYSKIAYTLFR